MASSVASAPEADLVFRALAEPRRREILHLLCGEPRSVTDLSRCLQITQPAVSQHLQLLKRAGLVNLRQDRQRHLYSLRPEGLSPADSFLGGLRPASHVKENTNHDHAARQPSRGS